jgi:hypothetical protein
MAAFACVVCHPRADHPNPAICFAASPQLAVVPLEPVEPVVPE